MGRNTWDKTDWSTYASASSLAYTSAKTRGLSDDAARKQVFTQTHIKDYMDPKKVAVRESRDSDANPNSRAIIIGLDVTGSMGFIAQHMATESLGKLIAGIIDNKPVTDPHICLMAVGDIFCDRSPLQVSQFETDISIAEQLKDLYLEGGGGGNSFESYDLPWIFAARRTSIDCFEKRGKKGYIFTLGDELPPQKPLNKQKLSESINIETQSDISVEDSLAAAQEMYNVFHVIVLEGDYARRAKTRVIKEWTDLLGKRAICLDNHKYVAEVIESVIFVNEGADPESIVNSWEDAATKKAVRYSLFGE